jgi:hypothetical protein
MKSSSAISPANSTQIVDNYTTRLADLHIAVSYYREACRLVLLEGYPAKDILPDLENVQTRLSTVEVGLERHAAKDGRKVRNVA